MWIITSERTFLGVGNGNSVFFTPLCIYHTATTKKKKKKKVTVLRFTDHTINPRDAVSKEKKKEN